jgi:hypothetical protein
LINILEKIKKELKSKEFWVAVAIAIPASMEFYFRDNPLLSFILLLPYGILILASLPLMAAVSFSVDIAVLFVRLHKKYHKIRAKLFKTANETSYSIREGFEKETTPKNFIFFNTWYCIGTTLLILQQIGIDKQRPDIIVVIMIPLIILSIIFISAINISIYLIKKRTIMFEDSDGTRVNLGSQLGNMINSAISATQVISFSYALVQSTAVNAFIGILILSLIICTLSSWFSFVMLKRKQIPKLMEKFAQKLHDHRIIS